VTADDAVSEVFVIVWRRLEDVPADALPWLLACARRVLANQRRAARRRHALITRLDRTRQENMAPDVGDGVLGRALAVLNDRDREVLLLIAWEGLDRRQAASVLGCTPEALSVRLHRARSRLSSAMERVAREDDKDAGPMEATR
jgi:RNA polymerase sigma-70 factor (ECF subfamily)